MKKSTFLAVAGVILAFFIVSAFGKIERAYEKKENFKNPEDAIVNFIGYVNSFELVKADNGSYRVPSREFLESISKRYRLYIGDDNPYNSLFEQVPILFNYEIKEVDFDSIINVKNNYENTFMNISNYSRDNDPIVYRLDGQGGYNIDVDKVNVNEDGTVKNVFQQDEFPVTIYLIVVNEGEGYVVDYYSVVYQ